MASVGKSSGGRPNYRLYMHANDDKANIVMYAYIMHNSCDFCYRRK